MKRYNTAFPYFPKDDIDEILAHIKEILIGNKLLTMGEYVNDFEQKFSNYIGTKYAIATSNGTTALHLALISLEIKTGDEVIVPSLSFIATANAVRYTGAKPIFVDSEIPTNFA